MSADYLKRLRSDSQAEDARQRMVKKGLTNSNHWTRLINELAAVPAWYEVLKRETRPAQTKRRKKLAQKIEAMADALRDDPEASSLRIYDHKSITTSNIKDRPYVADYLDDLAENITKKSSIVAHQLFDRRQSPCYPSGRPSPRCGR